MRIRLQRAMVCLGTFALLSACTPEQAIEEGPPLQPVVVYASYEDQAYLPTLLTEFTQETGIVVIVRNGTVPGIVDDVIGERVSPPADVLLTPSVTGVWRAAEEGALRPNYSEFVTANVPLWFQDPDQFWVALSYRQATLVYDPAQIDETELSVYEDLAAASMRRKVCLSSSGLSINRAVIAMLIRKLGPREAELAVRGWVANLAQPAFDSEEKLLRALQSGDCAIGIVSSDIAADTADSGLRSYTPTDAYADVEGLGVTRHARNPDGAFMLVDWLLSEQVQERHSSALSSFPVHGDADGTEKVVLVAVGDEEARKLAERARYR